MSAAEQLAQRLRASLPAQPAAPSAGEEVKQGRLLRTLCLASVQPKPKEWLWRNLIPSNTLTTLAGEGGRGKSLLTAHLAAVISRGDLHRLPGNEGVRGEPGAVLFVAGEDDLAEDIVPRLRAAGADMSKIHAMDLASAFPTFPYDLTFIEEEVKRLGVKLLVIDPLLGHLDSNLSANSDAEIRQALQPLMAMAHKVRCAVIAVAHTNKNESASAHNRVGGSVAIINTPRSALLLGEDDQDKSLRHIVQIKGNGKRGGAVRFHIEEATAAEFPELPPTDLPPRLVWPSDPWSDKDAGQILRNRNAAQGKGGEPAPDLTRWVMTVLQGGPLSRNSLGAQIRQARGKGVRRTDLLSLVDSLIAAKALNEDAHGRVFIPSLQYSLPVDSGGKGPSSKGPGKRKGVHE